MSLKPCLECDHYCSEDAWSCPSCGSLWPLLTKKEKNLAVFAFFILIFWIGIPLLVWLYKDFSHAIGTFIICSIISIPMFIGAKVYEKFF